MIDENGDIKISITEKTNEILEGFVLKARRKCLKRLKDTAAFDFARYHNSEGNLKYRNLHTTLKPLVKNGPTGAVVRASPSYNVV